MNQNKLKTFLGILALCLIIILIKQYTETSKIDHDHTLIAEDPFTNVKKYSPVLEAELEKYKLEQYTDVLLALMQQESRGKGGDPMQSSEAAGLSPNEIEDPNESIKQGVKHFNQVFTYGNKKKVDFPTIVQSYNMGMGYITFISEHGRKHSEQLAKQFSMTQVNKNPKIYNCGGDKNNFRYPYCYGDFTYSTKVAKNMEMITDSTIPTTIADEAASESY